MSINTRLSMGNHQHAPPYGCIGDVAKTLCERWEGPYKACSKAEGYFTGLRRGLCAAETDRMMSFPLPCAGSGVLDCATAASISAFTCGSANLAAESRRTKRF